MSEMWFTRDDVVVKIRCCVVLPLVAGFSCSSPSHADFQHLNDAFLLQSTCSLRDGQQEFLSLPIRSERKKVFVYVYAVVFAEARNSMKIREAAVQSVVFTNFPFLTQRIPKRFLITTIVFIAYSLPHPDAISISVETVITDEEGEKEKE